jgi:hypothetical protein
MEITLEEVKEKERWNTEVDGKAWLLGDRRKLEASNGEVEEFVGVEALTAIVMKSSTVWDIMTCGLLKVCRCFE